MGPIRPVRPVRPVLQGRSLDARVTKRTWGRSSSCYSFLAFASPRYAILYLFSAWNDADVRLNGHLSENSETCRVGREIGPPSWWKFAAATAGNTGTSGRAELDRALYEGTTRKTHWLCGVWRRNVCIVHVLVGIQAVRAGRDTRVWGTGTTPENVDSSSILGKLDAVLTGAPESTLEHPRKWSKCKQLTLLGQWSGIEPSLRCLARCSRTSVSQSDRYLGQVEKGCDSSRPSSQGEIRK